ncbi:MAG: hypothetical protein QFE16_06115 [Pseudomonadota bacterium]|nr:hypothetical protein [Pseudomonadota bacterium]
MTPSPDGISAQEAQAFQRTTELVRQAALRQFANQSAHFAAVEFVGQLHSGIDRIHDSA